MTTYPLYLIATMFLALKWPKTFTPVLILPAIYYVKEAKVW